MDDKEFEQSIKEYYKDKQKPENRTETIYVDVEKVLHPEPEPDQKNKFVWKETENGFEVEFGNVRATGTTMMKAIIRAHRKYKYNNIIGENKV